MKQESIWDRFFFLPQPGKPGFGFAVVGNGELYRARSLLEP